MAKFLDFRAIKKSFFPVTFKDGKSILVLTPKKKTIDELSKIQTNLSNADNIAELDETYLTIAKILSNNKTKTAITKEYVEKMLDIEDIIIFFNAYVDFVTELANQKN